MGKMLSSRFLARRSSVVVIVAICYFALLLLTFLNIFQYDSLIKITSVWFQYGASVFISIIFMATGILVWLYASDRKVAFYIFCYSCLITLCFTMLSGIGSANKIFSSICNLVSSSSIAIGLPFLTELLLIFPYNHFVGQEGVRVLKQAFMNVYRLFLWSMSVLLTGAFVYSYLFRQQLPWRISLSACYYLVGFTGLCVIVFVAYKRAATRQTRTQFRLFFFGLIIAFVPVLVLTILPSIFKIPYFYPVDGQISALVLVVFPLALSYSVLRYQLLIFDRYVRRAVSWIIGAVSLLILGYIAIVSCSIFFGEGFSLALVCVAIIMGGCSTFVWKLAETLTDHIFFSETLHYFRLIGRPEALANETFDLDEAAQVLSHEVTEVFETTQVCLFILNNERTYYTPSPPIDINDQNYHARETLMLLLKPLFSLRVEGTGAFDVNQPLIQLLDQEKRPLRLSQIKLSQNDAQITTGIGHYFADLTGDGSDVLLAPAHAQGRMIGVLVLGNRGEHQSYSGPDVEIIHTLLSRFSPVLETARVMLALREAYVRQKELDQLKDEFIVTASHELRTPLTAVQGYLELFNEHSLPPEMQQRFIEIALRNCDELVLMVENIMKASQMDLDTKQIKLAPVMLQHLVEQVIGTMEPTIRQEERLVTVDIPADIQVLADEHYLRLILLNLMGNALKYTPAGSAIEITCVVGDELVQVRVRDFGPGIEPEHQSKLFERFARLEKDMNSPVRGVGLGLFICKSLIEAMHGGIWVESIGQIPQGSAFVFQLKRVTVFRSLDFGELSGVVSQL